jgi:uncharacterized protein (DUF779 family)
MSNFKKILWVFKSFILPETTNDSLRTKEKNIELLPRLQEINKNLMDNNMCGILFGSSILSFHNNEKKVWDVDVLITKVYTKWEYHLDYNLADYFECYKRSFERIGDDGNVITKTIFIFTNSSGNRTQNVSLGFGLSPEDLHLSPWLIIPNKNTFWHIRQLEFGSVGSEWWSGISLEIIAILNSQFKKEDNNTPKLEWTYFWTDKKVNLSGIFEQFDYVDNNEWMGPWHTADLIAYLNLQEEETKKLFTKKSK